ncbi:hypothetical protein [Polymorphospora sp. NPDC051019]
MWSNRRRQRAEEARQAEQAAARAADAFLTLDSEQTSVAADFDLLLGVLAPADVPAARRSYDAAAGQCQRAIAAYLALNAPDAPPPATAALERSRADLDAARAALTRFAQWCRTRMAHAAAAITAAEEQAGDARDALAAATAAIEATRAAGRDTTGAQQQLARAREAYHQISEAAVGRATVGIRAAVAEARRQAEQARRLADEARTLPERTPKALGSLRTRVDGLRYRIGQLDERMSDLRREFVAACWTDLTGGAKAAHTELDAAVAAVGDAERRVTAGEWEAAWDAVTRARGHLERVTETVDAPGERLAALRAVRDDPRAESERTRRVIRDAQRFVLGLPGGPPGDSARQLDSRSALLQTMVGKLDVPHPDYWTYLTQLARIRTEVGELVDRIRQGG